MTQNNTWPSIEAAGTPANPPPDPATGICYFRSQVRVTDITDGTTDTYLLGEKYLDTDYYQTGQDHADNESMYCGFDNDNHRTTIIIPTAIPPRPRIYLPCQDQPGEENQYRFGRLRTPTAITRRCATARCERSITRSIPKLTGGWATAKTACRSTEEVLIFRGRFANLP